MIFSLYGDRLEDFYSSLPINSPLKVCLPITFHIGLRQAAYTMTITKHAGEMNMGYSLSNLSDYQSAQGLAAKAFEIFDTKLNHTISRDNKNLTAFVTNLENGLIHLNDSIAKKDSPLDVMMIVHTQIHPNLLEAFDLQLRK